MDYEKEILNKLVNAYRNSKKDTGENVKKRRTQIKPEKIYNRYHDNDGDYKKISDINTSVNALEEKGYISCSRELFGTGIQVIYLIDEKLSEIESYLAEKYGIVSKDNKLKVLEQIISRYESVSAVCKYKCQELKKYLANRQIPNNLDELNDILKVIAFIDNNNQTLYIREVSVQVYGDSKYFEENTIDSACKLLRKFNNEPISNSEIHDEILNRYHIFREPQKISIKGNALIHINGTDVDISVFENGIEFTSDELDQIDMVNIRAQSFMTIENRTSYLRYKADDKVILYLGGYADRYQRELIKLIYKFNPYITYLHFGDIDAGGFRIHQNLCKITEVKFEMFSMSESELANPEFSTCLHKLTDNDIKALKNLNEIPEYHDVTEYMLENKVKLEQEIISLKLMCGSNEIIHAI